jgi:alginate O-acetyltransferase complex protein AlgI
MPFTSGSYLVFLIVVFFAYWLIAHRVECRIVLLLCANYFFYAHAGLLAVAVLFAISTVDYVTTRLMSSTPHRLARKLLLSLSLAVDLGALCFFKYSAFFVDSVVSLLSVATWPVDLPKPDLVVPLGISFFVFQSVACVIDVYNDRTEPAASYLEHLAFVSFFPTIVAGPIPRANQLLKQMREGAALDAETGGQALFLIAIGLLKKIVIADYLSANLVDRVFDFPERFSSIEVLAGVYGYAIQLYADFSGYSDVAIGSAMLLGFRLPVNFNAPYRSRNLPEFWRRWHISLSTWLRDYIFFNLVGSLGRRSSALYIAVLITMLIGGLWHGPAWTFVVWGLMHGIGLCVARAYALHRKRRGPARVGPIGRAVAVVTTFHYVCLTWIIFRAETPGQAVAVIRQIGSLTFGVANLPLTVGLAIGLGFAAHWCPGPIFVRLRETFVRLPALAQSFVLLGTALGLHLVAGSDVAPFIYSAF